MAKSRLALAQERDFAQAGDGAEVALGECYRILRDQPLPELDRPSARAYIARDTKSSTGSLFARICEPVLIPRIDLMVHLRHMANIDVIRPTDWGSVDWSVDGERRFAVVFDRHGTPPLFPGPDGKFKPMAHDEILRRVIGPAAATLGLMAQRGLTHRAIRPYNIHLAKGGRTQLMLGDCVMGDHGSLHAAIFEPTEYAIVPVHGRGERTIADDLYALGVTALALAIGCIPLVQWSDEQVIEAKFAQDSFTALVGEDRPPQAMREILRGLLADDPLQRWTVADVEQYLNGGGHRIAELPTRTRAVRALEFAGAQHSSFRGLARAFGKNWRAGAQTIRTKSVEIWLKRYATEAELDGAIPAKVDSYAAASPESDAKLVMDVAAILDPSGPVRYKGLAAMPDGIGGLLAEAYRGADKQILPIIGDFIAKGMMIEFLEIATAGGRDVDEFSKYYKRMQLLLRNGGRATASSVASMNLSPTSLVSAPR